ncbi:potassium transporter [Catenaria anguillulae PL171]|uniref:Potassium transporter n=1 Tax=Catenaria anguillulae PL171 TaxID=765915 RepID=A0A1Y2HQK9_9FUNG|nr:potassium transporter [Catenaria anguillulae PL171]
MAKQQTEKAEEAESKGGRKGRRMSLGAALMMPPPPRVNDNMDVKTLIKFTVSALGILYGDVATGPMFIFKSAMRDSSPATLRLDVFGCLSFITWTTILLGVFKYCLIILHADNNGEGGQLALLSLIPQPDDDACPPWLARNYKKVFYLALIGTAFLLSDGLVGPALAMLAALEGFRVAEVEYPAAFAGFPVESWRVPVTCALLAPLFYVQRYGLGRITAVFPALMTVWFGSMAIGGAYNIYLNPSVLAALNPAEMFVFIARRGFGATMNMLSNVMLVASGLEFLYADLGVFRRKPILLSFTLVCVPATLLNYFGQAAFLLDANPTSTPALHRLTANLFFDSFPSWSIWPLVLMGCIVSAAGSQSAISGCFALLDQAISLRAVPTIESIHVVGYGGHGTFYVPVFCFILFVGGLLLAAITQDSEILSSTVGVCVAGAMLISSILLMIVMKVKWNFPRWKLAAYSVVLVLDIMLFLSSMAKLAELAWVTLIFSIAIVYIMFVYVHTWEDINKALDDRLWTLTQVRQHIRQHSQRVKGLGVFVACTDEEVPHVLTVLASRLPALPEDIVLLTVQCMKGLPFVAEEDRVIVRAVDPSMGVYRILISYGFAERSADVVQALAKAKKRGLKVKNEDNVTYYVSRYSVRTKREHPFYRRWQYKLYEALSRNTNNQVDALGLPVDKVVEVSNVLIL